MLLIFWFLTSCSVGCRRSTELSTILGYVFLLILSLTASSESTFLDDFSWPAQIKACNRVNFIVHLIINNPRGVIWGVSHSFSSHFSSSSFPAFVLCFGFDDHVLWVLAFLPPTRCIEQRVSLLRPRATWPWGVWGWAAWQTRLCVLQYTKLSLWSWDLAGECWVGAGQIELFSCPLRNIIIPHPRNGVKAAFLMETPKTSLEKL